MVSGITTEANHFEPVITVSATYGAGGSVIAPRLAEELALPFIDRLISADDSQHPTEARSQEGLVEGERETVPSGRFLSYFARAASVAAVVPPDPVMDEDEDIRVRVERALNPIRDGSGAVILGRAGAIVLSKRPRAFHVRLDGPTERRLAWALYHERLDEEAAKKRQTEADRARTAFVKRLYRQDPSNPTLYHMVIDPTVLGIDATVSVLKLAAVAFFERTA